jgi:hypothetical protein
MSNLVRNAGLGLLLLLLGCSDDSAPPPPATPTNDAGTSGDANVVTFCSSSAGADFCADFDRGTTPGADFDGVDATAGGQVALVTGETTTTGKALRTTLPSPGAPPATAQVARRIALSGKTKVLVDFKVRLADAKPAAGQLIRYFAFVIDGGSIGLFRNPEKWFMAVHRDNATAPDEDEEPEVPASALKLDTWQRMKLAIELGRPPSSNGKIALSVDDVVVLERTLATHGDAQPLSSTTLVLGLSHVAGSLSAPLSVDYDEATLRASAP